MEANIIGAIVMLLVVFGIIVCTLGLVSFTNVFKEKTATTTYHMADTATALINGDDLDAYLAGGKTADYQITKQNLQEYCVRMHVSLIYLIKVDTSDYGRFVSIFNPVDNSVDDTGYTEWELGHKRDTTNDEYRQKYKAIYENGSPYETVFRVKTTDGQHPHITTMVPVKDSAGKVVAILCMQRPIRELTDARKPYVITIAISAALLAVAASVFIAMFIKKQVVAPIRKVSAEAVRFASENTMGEGLGEISSYEELQGLAGSIDTMESDMVRYMENLTAATAEKERIGTELSLAKSIQENSIPHKFPAFPDRDEFDIYASMDPAKEVGGDFYNYFFIDDDHLAIVIGDVSGKGIPASLSMMATNIIMGNRAMMGGTPGEIMNYVNNRICAKNTVAMFVTLWLGILEVSTGRLTFTNAGHDDAAIYRKNGQFELLKSKHGLVAGGMPGMEYKDFEVQLFEGDKIFLYTDGVPEATDADNNMYTIARMLETLNSCKGRAPQQILECIRGSVDEFVGDAPQFDDITMLCIEYKKNHTGGTNA